MGTTIKLGNSFSQIQGLDPKAFTALRNLLSYTPDNYFSGGFNRPRYLLSARGDFPTGLLARVQNFLKSNKIDFHVNTAPNALIAPTSLEGNFEGIDPYDDQKAAVEAARRFKRGTICMPTGAGKTLLAALLIDAFRVKTLIVVPTLEIKRQMREAMAEYFGQNKNIVIENVDSKALQKASNYDLLIVDEAHHVASNTYQKLNKRVWGGIRYRFFLTATPFRNQADEQLLFEGIAGQVIFNLTYRQAVSKGYIVPVEAYYLELPKVPYEGYTWAEVYRDRVVRNDARNDLIARLMASLGGAFTLTLVKEIAHGNRLSELTEVPFVSGQDEDSRKHLGAFNSGDLSALIGTIGVLGEGVDTKPCEWVIIAGLGKAKSAFMQQVGRAVRRFPNKESAKIVIFKDSSHKFTLRHFRMQCKILEEQYGATPIKIEL